MSSINETLYVHFFPQVQELVPLGSMLQYLIKNPQHIGEYELKVWASQIACGMFKLFPYIFFHLIQLFFYLLCSLYWLVIFIS